jgi:hypothetical protein
LFPKEDKMMTDKRRSINIFVSFLSIAAVLGLLSVSGCGAPQFKSPLFQHSDYTTWGPNAMTWNGRDLVMGERNLIMEVNFIETENYLKPDKVDEREGFYRFGRDPISIATIANLNMAGIAWEGESALKGYLWVADTNSKQIYKLGVNYEVLLQLPAPGDSPRGLAYDGVNLWIADAKDSKIYKISPTDGSVIAEFNSPVKVPSGLAWDCAGLWVVGMDTCKPVASSCYASKLVRLDIETGRVVLEASLPWQITRPTSMAWVDGILWVGDSNLNRIFQLPSTGKPSQDGTVYLSTAAKK